MKWVSTGVGRACHTRVDDHLMYAVTSAFVVVLINLDKPRKYEELAKFDTLEDAKRFVEMHYATGA